MTPARDLEQFWTEIDRPEAVGSARQGADARERVAVSAAKVQHLHPARVELL